MQLFAGKLSCRETATGLFCISQTQASREIAQLKLQNIACNRDRDQYRNRIAQLENDLQLLKHENEQLSKQIMEQQTSKTLLDENRSLRSQLLLNTDHHHDYRETKIENGLGRSARHRTDRELQIWAQLCQIASSVYPSLNEIPDNEFSESVIELVSNVVHDLTIARTETRDLMYKIKHSEATLATTSNALAGLKTKLTRARAEQCLVLACNIALKQEMTKQQLVIRNVEDAMRRMKTLQQIQGKRHSASGAKTLPILEGELILQDRLFALNKFLEIFAGNGKALL